VSDSPEGVQRYPKVEAGVSFTHAPTAKPAQLHNNLRLEAYSSYSSLIMSSKRLDTISRKPEKHKHILCRMPLASYIVAIGDCSCDLRTTRADTETLGLGSLQRSIVRSSIAAAFLESCCDWRRPSRSEAMGCEFRPSQELGRSDGGLARYASGPAVTGLGKFRAAGGARIATTRAERGTSTVRRQVRQMSKSQPARQRRSVPRQPQRSHKFLGLLSHTSTCSWSAEATVPSRSPPALAGPSLQTATAPRSSSLAASPLEDCCGDAVLSGVSPPWTRAGVDDPLRGVSDRKRG